MNLQEYCKKCPNGYLAHEEARRRKYAKVPYPLAWGMLCREHAKRRAYFFRRFDYWYKLAEGTVETARRNTYHSYAQWCLKKAFYHLREEHHYGTFLLPDPVGVNSES